MLIHALHVISHHTAKRQSQSEGTPSNDTIKPVECVATFQITWVNLRDCNAIKCDDQTQASKQAYSDFLHTNTSSVEAACHSRRRAFLIKLREYCLYTLIFTGLIKKDAKCFEDYCLNMGF